MEYFTNNTIKIAKTGVKKNKTKNITTWYN